MSDQSSGSVRRMEAGVELNLFASLLTVSIYVAQIQQHRLVPILHMTWE